MGANRVLITGGGGYLGTRLARGYLASTDDPVALWIRASTAAEAQARQEPLLAQLGHLGDRVSYHYGDLADEQPFASVDPRDIRAIVHAAAVTRFNVDADTARQLNVEGTAKMLQFADRCQSLEAFGLLSTVYASGLAAGPVREVPLAGQEGFANHYEQSKWAAEGELVRRFGHLPWRIFRIATVIADDETGQVTQQNAVHNTLRLFYYGLLSLVPGKPDTPLYFVTGEFASAAVVQLMNHRANQVIYHVAHTRQESLTLGEVIDVAFETFAQDADFTKRRILKPLYSDAETFDLLAEGTRSFSGGIVNEAMASVAPFARQLFVGKDIQNENLVAALPSYRAPDGRELLRSTCRYLVQTRWGRVAANALG